MPGSQRWQGEEQFERSRNGNAALRLESIAGDQRSIPGIEKSEMARCVSWRGKRFERADAISFVQQKSGLRFADGIAAAQAYLRLGGVQALIAGKKTRVSLTDCNLGIRQSIMQRVE